MLGKNTIKSLNEIKDGYAAQTVGERILAGIALDLEGEKKKKSKKRKKTK